MKEQEKEEIKAGSKLTLITEIGNYNVGDIVEIEKVITTGGYYSDFFRIWMPEKLSMIKIKGVYGHWFPRCFKETKHINP